MMTILIFETPWTFVNAQSSLGVMPTTYEELSPLCELATKNACSVG